MSTPGIHADLAELIALRLRAPELAAGARRRTAEPTGGAIHSPFRGRGMDYAESRPYAPGDDVRHIDWKVTARSGRVHTKLFQSERERVTAIVADTSPTMAFGTRACFKSVQAARIGALLAWLANAEGDRLCAASCGAVDGLVRPAGGRRGILRTLEALAEWYRPPLAAATTPLQTTLERLSRLLRPGSHILLLLDPRSVGEECVQALTRLRAHHDLAACVLVDPLEAGTPPPARYRISDGMDHRATLALDDADNRVAWQRHFEQLLQDATLRLQRGGARVRIVRTDEDPLQALRALLRGVPSREVA